MKKLLMRELLHAVPMVTTIGIGASPGVAEDTVDQQFGTVHFNTSTKRHSAASIALRGIGTPSGTKRPRRFRGSAQGRSVMRHRLLGHCTRARR
jgi:hypothetical protein